MALWVAMALTPLAAQYAPDSQHPASNESSRAQAEAGDADGRIPPSSVKSGADQQQAAKEAVPTPGSWPDWVIVAFTGALLLVAWLQHRLETRTASETKDALQIARDGAAAAKKSADAAASLAAAAAESNKLTRDLFVAEQRPEMFFVEKQLLWVEMSDQGAISASVIVKSKNKGKTPAGEFALFMNAFPFTNGIAVRSRLIEYAGHVLRDVLPTWPIKVSVAAGDPHTHQLIAHLSPEDIKLIDFGGRVVFGLSICAFYKMAVTGNIFMTGTSVMVEYMGDMDRILKGEPGGLAPVVMNPDLGDDIRT